MLVIKHIVSVGHSFTSIIHLENVWYYFDSVPCYKEARWWTNFPSDLPYNFMNNLHVSSLSLLFIVRKCPNILGLKFKCLFIFVQISSEEEIWKLNFFNFSSMKFIIMCLHVRAFIFMCCSRNYVLVLIC